MVVPVPVSVPIPAYAINTPMCHDPSLLPRNSDSEDEKENDEADKTRFTEMNHINKNSYDKEFCYKLHTPTTSLTNDSSKLCFSSYFD